MATVSASRFAALHIDDIDDSDNEEKNQTKKDEGKTTKSNSAKKRARKKKKNQQIQAENAQLRDLAFSKIPSKTQGSVSVPSLQTISDTLTSESRKPSNEASNGLQWREWSDKDKGYVNDQFEHDLQRALLQSKLEYEQQKAFYEETNEDPEVAATQSEKLNRKERRKLAQKDKPQPMTLQQLHSGMGLEQIPQPHIPKAKKTPVEDDQFFDKLDRDVEKLVNKEEREQFRKANEKFAAESVRQIQHADELSKKDEEIQELRQSVEKLKEELQTVKKRNKQLCFILAQGEMKEKASILKQVDELTSVKDELTQQVTELHTALEQERSKVSSLKNDLQKYDKKK
ncbi:G kinase-anchoring protein 1-like [Ptychodera flava]|uniref:G kinase-anchoring protein 1-like n=1 Tax=Ptychodera flava TaxID=63121 RepID=UPI00396A1008